MRCTEMQDWPAWLNPATAIWRAARSQSPSGSMMTGALLPSSRATFLRPAFSAIAAGCPVVLKPAGQTPLSAPDLAESGVWPAGLRTTGQPAAIAEKAGRKKVALELGNNAPVIIEPDGDWDRAARQIAVAGFSHAGQSCISVQRIYVHADVADEFTATLAKLVSDLVVGDPMDEATDVSALISGKD